MLSCYTLGKERRYFLTRVLWVLIYIQIKHSENGHSKSSGFCCILPEKVSIGNKRFTVKHSHPKWLQLKKALVFFRFCFLLTNKSAGSVTPKTNLGKRKGFYCQNVASNARFPNEAVTPICG